jgi:hypothetical protein
MFITFFWWVGVMEFFMGWKVRKQGKRSWFFLKENKLLTIFYFLIFDPLSLFLCI